MRSVPRHDRMAWATLIMIAALLAQFVLGMAANLFVTIPAHHPGASPNNYFVGAGHSVVSEDFGGDREALEAIAQALDERRSLVLAHARYDREAGQSGVIINLANMVSVRVSKTDSAATGQYL